MKTWVLAVLLSLASSVAIAQEITVVAAADLNYALRDLAAQFQSQTGVKVKLAFGSSGNFTAQIENGAPFDAFFSADTEYPQKLSAEGYVVPGSLYEYAVGHLVLWTRSNSPLDLSKGMSVLLDPSIHKIAIANPQHAPYGRAAVAALKSARVYDNIAAKLVLGENISQTAQFVQTGNADVGIIALSLAVAPSVKASGRYVEVPADLYPPLRQAAVILKSSPHKDAARRFLDFIKTPAATKVLSAYGFAR